jgi:aryl-alcohol dehydrogenase-like predicted oxidoreductase
MRDRMTAGGTRIGLGLAALGRPGYINLGHGDDLPPGHSVDALRQRTHELLDEAYACGVRYTDVARSYGLGEEFLASWLSDRTGTDALVVGSKWGYTYTADWRVSAEVHETKDHTPATFDRQLAETRALLGDRLELYQIHSVTPESTALRDEALHRKLAGLAAEGVSIGLSTSGTRQSETIRTALEVQVDGRPLFGSVQATWNLLEPSAGAALADAHADGRLVIVKEAVANGRLTGREPDSPAGRALAEVAAELADLPDGTPGVDAVALAAVLYQPWAGIVLSGASTTDQLASNLRAGSLRLTAGQLARLARFAEPAPDYWRRRAALPWN